MARPISTLGELRRSLDQEGTGYGSFEVSIHLLALLATLAERVIDATDTPLTVSETRYLRLLALVARYPRKADFAREIGVSPVYLSQLLKRRRNVGNDTAKSLFQ